MQAWQAWQEEQREKEAAAALAANQDIDLRALFTSAPWAAILGEGLQAIGVTNGTAEAAAAQMAPAVVEGLVAWLQEREGEG